MISAPLSILAGFSAGAILAFAARRALHRNAQPLRTRYGLVALMYGVAVSGPAALVLHLLAPAWSLMYVTSPSHFPRVLLAVATFLAHAAAPVFGFAAAHQALEARSPKARRFLVLGVLILAIAILFFGFGRLTTVAHFESYHYAKEGISLFGSALFLPVVLIGGAAASTLVFSVMHVRRHVELSEDVPPPLSAAVRSATRSAHEARGKPAASEL